MIIMFYFRILEFVGVFLEAVLSGEEDLVKCANKAYEDVLKRYHGWIIRGIFHVRWSASYTKLSLIQ